MKNHCNFLVPLVALLLASCSSFPLQGSYQAKDEALPRGMVVDLGVEKEGLTAFRLTGGELEGAKLLGEARRSGDGWILEITGIDYFSNWKEGWTEARFAAEGSLALAPEGEAWRMTVSEEPRIEEVQSASIRLYGNYFEGDKALALIRHRWDRIQAVNKLLKERFPDLGESFAPKGPGFEKRVRTFLFPELYGFEGAAKGSGKARAESIDWDTEYTKGHFPEELRALRDTGTMLRDFEEGSGLWRLDAKWDGLWRTRVGAASFIVKK